MKMDTIFMNSKNSKTSKHHLLILHLTFQIDLRKGEKLQTCKVAKLHINAKLQSCT